MDTNVSIIFFALLTFSFITSLYFYSNSDSSVQKLKPFKSIIDFSSFRRFQIAKWRPVPYDWLLEPRPTNVIDCVRTKTKPKFTICIFPSVEDRYVSASIRSNGNWELHITNLIKKSLNAHPHAIFLDIGANIGYFSLLAAAMNRKVVAVEANPTAIRLFHASVLRNYFHKQITLFLLKIRLNNYYIEIQIVASDRFLISGFADLKVLDRLSLNCLDRN